MKIEYLNIDDIIPYENNPRRNDDAVDYVANSIKEFGFKVPIIIDKDNVVVTGHTRLKASEKLGLKKIPVIYADDLTEDQIKAFRIADNKVSEFSSWDLEKLGLELEELGNIDLGLFGFEKFDEEESKIEIEDIDGLVDIGDGGEKFAIELGEANNYVVLEFDTESEWEKAQEVLNLQRVATRDKNPNIRRFGIGRVIKGKKIIDKLGELDED